MRVLSISTPLRINGQPLRNVRAQNPIAFGSADQYSRLVNSAIKKLEDVAINGPDQVKDLDYVADLLELKGKDLPDFKEALEALRKKTNKEQFNNIVRSILTFLDEINP